MWKAFIIARQVQPKVAHILQSKDYWDKDWRFSSRLLFYMWTRNGYSRAIEAFMWLSCHVLNHSRPNLFSIRNIWQWSYQPNLVYDKASVYVSTDNFCVSFFSFLECFGSLLNLRFYCCWIISNPHDLVWLLGLIWLYVYLQ